MIKGGHVYIMTNKHRTTLYVGVTARLVARTDEHKQHLHKKSFTGRYNLEYIVYYERHDDIRYAIEREKEIKKWNRQKKNDLITSFNPEWKDMWGEITGA